MSRFARTALASALALALTQAAAAAEFSNVVIFGDSLSDGGQYGSRFTTNPGQTAMEDVANYFGFAPKPSSQGGTDFAYGGARVTQLPGVPATPPTGTAPPVSAQVSSYLAAGPVDSHALYSVWAGANDIFFQAGLAGAGQITSAQVQANVAQAAADELAQIARLQAAGAHNIIVINLPDIGRTPAGQQSGAATFTALSSLYNTILSDGLGRLGLNVIPINAFALLNEVLANPGAYGFANAVLPACTTASSITCTPATLRDPSAASTFVFADGVHITTGAHQLLAQYIESVIEAPEKIGLLAEAPLQVVGTQRRAVEGRYLSDHGPARSKGQFEVYTAYDYNDNKFARSSHNPGSDGTGSTLTIGGDMQINNAVSAGVVFGYGQTQTDLDASGGNFKLNATSLSAYAAYRERQFYLGGMLTVADLDYKDVRRNIALGSAVRTESGNTKGTLGALSLTGGYLIPAGGLSHGPVGGLTYQDVSVDNYSESGANSTTMSFGEQDRKSLVGSLGYQLFGQIKTSSMTIYPFARASYEHEFKNDDRVVRAGLVTMNGTFEMPTFKPDTNDWRLELGVSAKLTSAVTGFVNYSGIVSQSNAKSNAVTVGVKLAI
jgi:outer membrane lipase/esterase